MEEDKARARAQMPKGTINTIGKRSLAADHRALLPLLSRGISVLDGRCGNGALTADIATRVEPGTVVGVDINDDLLADAR